MDDARRLYEGDWGTEWAIEDRTVVVPNAVEED